MDRFRAVIKAVEHERSVNGPIRLVGLTDRKNGGALGALDLERGELRPAGSDMFDLILVDHHRHAPRQEPDFHALKTRLATEGLILLRRRTRFSRWVGRLLSRRRDDAAGGVFGRGHDRREAGLRRASLYLGTLQTRWRGKNEEWLLASTVALSDERVRDHIGRVAADHLRCWWPTMLGIGSSLPSL